jgi:hypothetical protein
MLLSMRFLRTLTLLDAPADYKTALNAVPEADSEARQQALHACHQRSADKLLKLCFDNGGIYIKLGQHIGQLVSSCCHGAVMRCLQFCRVTVIGGHLASRLVSSAGW